jgi:hypothetical protein
MILLRTAHRVEILPSGFAVIDRMTAGRGRIEVGVVFLDRWSSSA